MKNIRYFLTYLLAVFFCAVIRISPRFMVRFHAWTAAHCVYLMPSALKICQANIQIAFPDWDADKVRRTAKTSIRMVILNFLEFIWMSGIPRRIEKVCQMPETTRQNLRKYADKNVRIIFVNPHLGSWEASGLMAPYFAGVQMAAIAKPSKNKYLNKLLSGNREKAEGLKIIFARGAMRAAVKALREGLAIGTLIDQNTRGRDGGTFVDFFGLPAPSSTAPALLKRYCDSANIPSVIIYGTSIRENNVIRAYCAELAKPFNEYADDREVLQELMRISEDFIRRYPEQYVWLYKRFRYIPIDADETLCRRYPYYAVKVKPSFYNSLLKRKQKASEK